MHTVHLFLTERMSSAKRRGPPPPFPLFVRGVRKNNSTLGTDRRKHNNISFSLFFRNR